MLKFLLVEDHPMMRAAIRTVVETLSGDVATAEAGTVAQARELLAHHGRFDAVVLEIRVGGADGVALLREMRATQPGMPVMVFTGSDDGRDLIRAVDGGAMAFVQPPQAVAGDGLVLGKGGDEAASGRGRQRFAIPFLWLRDPSQFERGGNEVHDMRRGAAEFVLRRDDCRPMHDERG